MPIKVLDEINHPFRIFNYICLRLNPKGSLEDMLALIQAVHWRRLRDKPIFR